MTTLVLTPIGELQIIVPYSNNLKEATRKVADVANTVIKAERILQEKRDARNNK